MKRIKEIIVPIGTTRTFKVGGRSFLNVKNVYLSGAPYTESITQNPFANVPRLSAMYPAFLGVKLLSSDYTVINDQSITFTMPSASRSGFVDVIVENMAGYGSLTTYAIKELYGTQFTNAELRPWSTGIQVGYTDTIPFTAIPADQIYTISDDVLLTIAEENIILIGDVSTETYYILTDDSKFIITDTSDKIVYGT